MHRLNQEAVYAQRKRASHCSPANYEDSTPITHEWLESVFPDKTINGYGLIIDGEGDPIELYLLEDLEDEGIYRASMMQSDPADSIAITGRVFKTRGDVHLLLNALRQSIEKQ